MPPFNYEENIKPNENCYYLDEEQGFWKLVTRKSSFSDINRLALSNASNSVNARAYAKEFQRYVKNEKKKVLKLERSRNANSVSWIWQYTFERLGDDWMCLAMLGIFMALLSVGVDKGINLCLNARLWLYHDITTSLTLSYIGWIILPTILVLFAVTFVKLLAPQSVGSGIPEVKTILRGFPIENHLTFKTLIAKVIGLTATLGSGLPLGKEAPFVHISCIVARLINKIALWIKGIQKDDTQNTEMLVAGCAAGIAACFASPIGGVLYSIEATSTYFAVRNYWRAFFTAVCSAVVFRLHAVWSKQSDTITALFATDFTTDFPFDPLELFIFALIGYLLYPTIVVVVISAITYPFSFCHVAGHLSTHDQMIQLFANFSWNNPNLTEREANIVANWKTDNTGVIQNLIVYFLYTFFFSIIASTIAVPSGTFIPVLKMGACLGRLIGESIHMWFPFGVYFSERISPVIPGGYAVVGAVAFAGACTHTMSVAVMALEITGQISLIAPIMIALLFSNATAVYLCLSIYDAIISLKKLPYITDLLPEQENHDIILKNFMVKDINYIWKGINYSTLQTILMETQDLHHLPLVESHENMVLLGSVQRNDLIKIIARQICREKRLQVAAKWQTEVEVFPSMEKGVNEQTSNRHPSIIEATGQVNEFHEVISNEELTVDEAIINGHEFTPKLAENSIANYTDSVTPNDSNYTTITDTRSSFDSIFRKNEESTELSCDLNSASISPVLRTVQMLNEEVTDMSLKYQKHWEVEQLNERIDFNHVDIIIDPAPFQLVEKTCISKVHGLFTKLGLRRAYVTQFGKLVGVVSLNELRTTMEDINNGNFMIECNEIGSFPFVNPQTLLDISPLLNTNSN